MRHWKPVTAAVLIIVAVALIGFDIFLEIHAGDAATISQVVYWGARTCPAIAFAAGFLCGHLFWPQNVTRADNPWRNSHPSERGDETIA